MPTHKGATPYLDLLRFHNASDDTLIVADMFCGGGGWSEGLNQACKERGIEFKLLALNHAPVAAQDVTCLLD